MAHHTNIKTLSGTQTKFVLGNLKTPINEVTDDFAGRAILHDGYFGCGKRKKQGRARDRTGVAGRLDMKSKSRVLTTTLHNRTVSNWKYWSRFHRYFDKIKNLILYSYYILLRE
jgi:hypothetical protein